MIRVMNSNKPFHIFWPAAAGGVKAGQLVMDNGSQAVAPVAGDFSTTSLLGIATETVADTGAIVDIYPLAGTLLEIDYYSGASKKTLADADIGLGYDINVNGSTGEMTLDLDDNTGSFIVQRYDNTRKKAICALPAAKMYLNV